eukprot:2854547-Amphidinium_carterae.1
MLASVNVVDFHCHGVFTIGSKTPQVVREPIGVLWHCHSDHTGGAPTRHCPYQARSLQSPPKEREEQRVHGGWQRLRTPL